MLAVIQCRVLSANLVFKKVKIKKHGNIISPVVRYGCKTWSLKLREQHSLRMFENRVLRGRGYREVKTTYREAL
jgi:hypothetical protein